MFYLSKLFIAAIVYFSQSQGLSIVPSQRNVVKFLGESYFASCQSDTEMGWYDPKDVNVSPSSWSRIRVENGFGLDLFINYIREDDEGVYSCVTKSDRQQFNLTVVRPILFDLSLAVQTACFGEDFVMKCSARGNTAPCKIYWKIDRRSPKAKHFLILENGNLLIKKPTAADAHRKYKCRAVDANSPKPDVKEMEIVLKVEMKPSATGNESLERWGVVGEWINLTCSVIADPPADFAWYHKSTKLENTNTTIISSYEDNMSHLEVFLRNESTLGVYICAARNRMGTYNQVLIVNKGIKPSKPILQVESLGRFGAGIRVIHKPDPTVGLEITQYIVQYKIISGDNWETAYASQVIQTDYGFILRGLIPNVTYMIRVALENQASISDFSAALQFSTPRYGHDYPTNEDDTEMYALYQDTNTYE